MASQMEAQFAGSETVLTQPNTVAFVQGKELGPGLLSIDEKWVGNESRLVLYGAISISAGLSAGCSCLASYTPSSSCSVCAVMTCSLPPRSYLSWVSDDQSQQFSLEYPNISIHAISRDTSAFPHPCLYLMHCPQGGEGEGEEEEMEEEEKEEGGEDGGVGEGVEGEEMAEIRLVPQDPNQCKLAAVLVPFKDDLGIQRS